MIVPNRRRGAPDANSETAYGSGIASTVQQIAEGAH